MHENIKYTLSLDEKIEPLRSREDLKNPAAAPRGSVGDWQSIFAETIQHTHFFVYAKLIGKKEGETFRVKKIQLFVQNYKGSVTYGFTGLDDLDIKQVTIDANDPEHDPRHPNKTKYELSFGVGALRSSINCVEKDVDVVFKNYDIIQATPIFSPAENEISQIFEDDDKRRNTNYADPLFMQRVGEDVKITDEGYARLELLGESGFDNAIQSQVSNLLSHKNTIKSLTEIEFLGLKYPCQPRNTMIKIQS